METPDAIIILSAGTISNDGSEQRDHERSERIEDYHSTTYEEGDGSGVLAGYARVHAAALLGAKYPSAVIVPTGKRDWGPKSHAVIIKRELEELGVAPERIVLEEDSVNTLTQLHIALSMAVTRGWKQVIFVTNEYQIPRVKAFMEYGMVESPQSVAIEYQAAEPVLIEADPAFATEFEEIKARESYQLRLAAEMRGVEQVKAGTYRPLPPELKLERPMTK